MFCVVNEAVNSGIIDLLENGELPADELLLAAALQAEAGRRFIELLVTAGVLVADDGLLSLSPFSSRYLKRSSATCQRNVLAFEPILMANWQRLGDILQQGQGALMREQSPDDYRKRLDLYQRAMGEAALVRSGELWDALNQPAEQGTILDIGAGDGTYLREFLNRHPGWQAVACDLPDVCDSMADQGIPENMRLYPCNILDQQEMTGLVGTYRGRVDLLLVSNLCHCYGPEETTALLGQVAGLLKEHGQLIVHDFFRDANPVGALYDLHMLVNTYNGLSYTTSEMVAMLQQAGFVVSSIVELPSRSLGIIASLK